mmetsp:Transcript_60133/g.134160  ORF Transcript_60133/g.134160 Transcript_60133/m.134160 type:complete len:211 (-) Transcript_60133:23-655(-)
MVRPGVPDRLMPTRGEEEATIVVVAKNSQPLLPVQTWTFVHLFKDGAPLVPAETFRKKVGAAVALRPTPVEVVAYVEHVVRWTVKRPVQHLPCHSLLRTIIHPFHELPVTLREERGAVVSWHDWHVRSVLHAAPVTDHEDVQRGILAKANIAKSLSIVFGGILRRLWWQIEDIVTAALLLAREAEPPFQEAAPGRQKPCKHRSNSKRVKI